ncbi:MAG: magnesium transporter CorA family protein [Devosia sp.]
MLTTYELQGDRLVVRSANLEPEDARVVWIDMLDPAADEDLSVENLLGINIPSKAEMEEIELSNRLYQEDGAEFMTVTALAGLSSSRPSKTPITFILKAETLVTVRYSELKPFDAYLARATRTNGTPCSTGEAVMLGIVEALIDRTADALEQIGNDVDGLSRSVFDKREASTKAQQRDLETIIQTVGRKSDLLTMLQESLVSIARLAAFHTPAKGAAAQDEVHMVVLIERDAAALGDHARALSGRMSFLLDATLGLINLQQNQIIKIVSVAALVFLPPTLVASIYGMNFHNMPELGWDWGYPMALGMMILSAVLPYLFFKRRGWL